MGKEEGLGGGVGEVWGRRGVGRRVTGEEGDGSVPSSHSTLHNSHHPANTDFNSSLASGTMVFFSPKVSDETAIFTAGCPAALFCSASLDCPMGLGSGTKKRDLAKGT